MYTVYFIFNFFHLINFLPTLLLNYPTAQIKDEHFHCAWYLFAEANLYIQSTPAPCAPCMHLIPSFKLGDSFPTLFYLVCISFWREKIYGKQLNWDGFWWHSFCFQILVKQCTTVKFNLISFVQSFEFVVLYLFVFGKKNILKNENTGVRNEIKCCKLYSNLTQFS